MTRQKRLHLDWQVVEDEQAWQHLTTQNDYDHVEDSTVDKSRPVWLQRALFLIVLCLVVIALGPIYLFRQASTGLAQVETELADIVQIESWAAANETETVLNTVLDPAAPSAWRDQMLLEHAEADDKAMSGLTPFEVEPLLFEDDVALVKVRMHTAAGAVYVVDRFYRETEAGWVRTTPRPAFFGTERHIESRYFRFIFHQRDSAAVEVVAGAIDDVYLDLRQELGLPIPNDTQKFLVHVTVPESPAFALLRSQFVGDNIDIPSPTLLPVLESATQAQALQETIHQALVYHIFAQIQEDVPVRRQWHVLVTGIRLWQLQQATGTATWQRESLGWLYSEWPTIRLGHRKLEPSEADWLCAIGTSSTRVVANSLLPGACSGNTPAELLQWMPLPPQHLTQIRLLPQVPANQEHWLHSWQQQAILASIVDYGVSAYGHHTLPALLQSTAHYDNWETLIPAVYGVSAGEFEAGWLAYLTQ